MICHVNKIIPTLHWCVIQSKEDPKHLNTGPPLLKVDSSHSLIFCYNYLSLQNTFQQAQQACWVFLAVLHSMDLDMGKLSPIERTKTCNHELKCLNPITPMSDQDRISPYNINTISSRQVMRIKKNINKGIISWSNTKFSKLTSQELYGRQ